MTPTTARPGSSVATGLSDRSRRILTTLVAAYIEHGRPVSSLWLARHGGVGLSSASVRNTLAELEDLGYVEQPHPSAGRVPTDRGYRCYVDCLLERRRWPRAPQVGHRLPQAATLGDLLASVSQELSRVAHNLAFALGPASDAVALEHIDFVPLGGSRVLVVVIAAGGEIAHKAVDVGEQLAPTTLAQAANYLNSEFTGWPLWKIRAEIHTRLEQDRVLYDTLAAHALRLAGRSLADLPPHPTLVVQGASRLLEEAAERLPLETLRALFAMIEEKDRLVRLLNEYVDGPGLTVVIGAEHAAPALRDFSLVASTYSDGQRRGTVGVIGPRRMQYSRALAAVDRASRAVSRALETAGGFPHRDDARATRHATA
jgi:heat-inducible transcriptional repressor